MRDIKAGAEVEAAPLGGDTRVPFSPVPQAPPDLVDTLAEVARAWRRDDGVRCRVLLEAVLDEYPWSLEASDWYGLVMSKIRHIYSDRAMVRLHNWISLHQAMTGKPYAVNEGLLRFQRMKEVLSQWLLGHRRRRGKQAIYPRPWVRRPRQWAEVADIGSQMGEMAINWIGLPGAHTCVALDIAISNLRMGRDWYDDPRLHWVQAIAHALPLRGSSLDVAFLSGILEHVRNPDDLVAEAERVVRPGGLIVIQTPYGGMEGAPNRAADTLGFRSHVRSIDPRAYALGHPVVDFTYIRYTGNVSYPHAMYGECGDLVLAYER